MQGLLERLAQGPVIGDGGFVFALEKRGYVKVHIRDTDFKTVFEHRISPGRSMDP